MTLEIPRISQSELNIEEKTRSNPLTWKGQFSPQLVEAHLRAYAVSGQTILDPFAGSGTVLLESLRLGMKSIGVEINPAAVSLARLYSAAKLPGANRAKALDTIEDLLRQVAPMDDLPLFGGALSATGTDSHAAAAGRSLVSILEHLPQPSLERDLAESLVVAADLYAAPNWSRVSSKWREIRTLVESLPFSESAPTVYLGDARSLPATDQSVDLVFTSPPYINVFNYHQQYRLSTEAVGWSILPFARCEIGSNRKFRGNRLLTVVQYCLDMSLALREVARVMRPGARAIFVVGRESNVRKTPFFNAELLKDIAAQAAGAELVLQQERVFSNRFGQSIYEDILHFRCAAAVPDLSTSMREARSVARAALSHALGRTTDTSIAEDIQAAIEKTDEIEVSDFLRNGSVDLVPACLHTSAFASAAQAT